MPASPESLRLLHPVSQKDPLGPHTAAKAFGQCCVTSGVKVIVTINGALKSQPAAPCLFPARDLDKLIGLI